MTHDATFFMFLAWRAVCSASSRAT
jgi:hypothetical protein